MLVLQKREKKIRMIEETSVQVTDSKERLLVAYEFSGCSSTFSVFEQGKLNLLKILQKSEALTSVSQIMPDYWAMQKHFRKSGVKAFILLYGGNGDSILGKMW